MITEERKKELAERCAEKVKYSTANKGLSTWIKEYLNIAAAEAQEEGCKELVEARELLAEIEAIADNSVVVDMCQNYFEQLKKRE